MADPLAVWAVIAIPFVLTTTAWMAWKTGRITADRQPVLTPTDADDDPGLYAWTATVQYDATGNVERFVIQDHESLTKRQTRRAIEDQVPGADVIELDQHRLYAIDPAVRQAVDD